MMISLQRRIKNKSDGDREQHFFLHTLKYLTSISGHLIQAEAWMVTFYEVEFGSKIGSGGL